MTPVNVKAHPTYGPFLSLYENRGSFKSYVYRLRLFQTFLGNRDPLAVSKSDLLAYNEWMKARAHTPWTKRQNLSVVREFYRYLEAFDLIQKSPALILRYVREKNLQSIPRPLPPMDRIALMNSLQVDTPDKLKVSLAVRLGMENGLRVSEMAALPRSAVHFRLSSLVVTGKGGTTRSLPMTATLSNWFAEWFRKTSSPWVFFSRWRPEKHVAEKMVNSYMRTAARWAGLNSFTTHELRHTYGSVLAETGATSQEIKVLMGHSCILTSDSYVRLCGDQARTAHRRAFEPKEVELERRQSCIA